MASLRLNMVQVKKTGIAVSPEAYPELPATIED